MSESSNFHSRDSKYKKYGEERDLKREDLESFIRLM